LARARGRIPSGQRGDGAGDFMPKFFEPDRTGG